MQAPAAPGTGDKLDLKSLLGSLLYVTVTEYVTGIETSFGVTDAIRANVAVLDGEHKGDTLNDTLIFPSVLVGQLKSAVGATDPNVVGRLGQGLAKPGKSAPWVLNEPSPADLDVATKYEGYAERRKAEAEEEAKRKRMDAF
jgi:hypothetical protein